MAEIEKALDIWRVRRSISGAVAFIISVLGTVGGLVGIAKGVKHLPWYGWLLVAVVVFNAYLFVVGSFVAKRGLMLGGSASAGYVPALIEDAGAYRLEREVFDPLGVERREIPLDLVLADLFIALAAAGFFATGLWLLGVVFAIALLINVIAYLRRLHLCRL